MRELEMSEDQRKWEEWIQRLLGRGRGRRIVHGGNRKIRTWHRRGRERRSCAEKREDEEQSLEDISHMKVVEEALYSPLWKESFGVIVRIEWSEWRDEMVGVEEGNSL